MAGRYRLDATASCVQNGLTRMLIPLTRSASFGTLVVTADLDTATQDRSGATIVAAVEAKATASWMPEPYASQA